MIKVYDALQKYVDGSKPPKRLALKIEDEGQLDVLRMERDIGFKQMNDLWVIPLEDAQAFVEILQETPDFSDQWDSASRRRREFLESIVPEEEAVESE